jgi:hypothetical protein
MRIKDIFVLLLLIPGLKGMTQEPEPGPTHWLSFKSQYVQIKDVYNYGLAHRGLNLAGAYSLTLVSEGRVFGYETGIGFGANFNRGAGLAWSFKPFDLFYGFRLNDNPNLTLTLGPYLSGYYKWHLYPELQSGHMLWFSSYETGPELWASVPLEKRMLSISVALSLFAVNSRPQNSPETYFYSLTFNDFVSNVHSDMKLGTLASFQHFNIQLALSNLNGRFRIAYEFDYLGYSEHPEYQYLTHSLNLTWQVGNKNKN